MSGLTKPKGPLTGAVVNLGSAALGLVDPTVELTQPGGPFDYGEAILTDGAGGYTIAPTLRPYFRSFRIPDQVPLGGIINCEYQGVLTTVAGAINPLVTNLIAITVVVGTAAIAAGTSYTVEIVRDPATAPTVIGTLVIDDGDGRSTFRRDLSVGIPAGVEIGARITQTAGASPSTFSEGIIDIELEG